MLVQADTDARATYVALHDGVEVARTAHVSDAVLIDVDVSGEPTGIEVLRLPWEIDEDLVSQVEKRFPELAARLRDAVAQTLHGPSR